MLHLNVCLEINNISVDRIDVSRLVEKLGEIPDLYRSDNEIYSFCQSIGTSMLVFSSINSARISSVLMLHCFSNRVSIVRFF